MSVFLLRAVIGIIGAFVLMRFFYPGAHVAYSVVLAAVLVFLAYMAERLRRDRGGPGEP